MTTYGDPSLATQRTAEVPEEDLRLVAGRVIGGAHR